MSFQNVKITILYGSQTGNAQDVGERLWRESKRFYFQSCVKPLNDFNIAQIAQERCIIFICSTTGQGEEPDNMKIFWKFLLKKSLPKDFLSQMKFAVLGLGDSSYSKFNFVAKRLYKRLLQLGGEPLIELGLGDDQHDFGYDAVTDPWMEKLWIKLNEVYPLPLHIAPLSANLAIIPRWTSVQTKNVNNLLDVQNNVNKYHSNLYSTETCDHLDAVILENRSQTHKTHFQDVRLIKFKTNGQKYAPGDLLVLRPKNLSWKILEFKNILTKNGVNIKDETVINLKENDPNMPVPEVLKRNVTFKLLCEEYFDLFSIPRRHVFQLLSQITDSELEKEKCLEFCSGESREDMYAYTTRPRRNIVEVLDDFPHATKNLTLDILFEILPPIKPREFSIASSFKRQNNEVHLLVAVVKYKTNLVKERIGLCSNFLADLNPGDQVYAWLKGGSFKFPSNLDVPVIMVGPGTGVAPFRSFILEMCEKNKNPKNLLLFFGCRYEAKDFLFKEEFVSLRDDSLLTLVCAFSRDQKEKSYVQHKIKENGELVWNAIERNCYIFVAGNSKNMPQQVREAFVSVCVNYGRLQDSEAVKKIDLMVKQGRYQTECWS
ncbi:NADPH-dependent diflavin oxidoreductase 1 isoform X1 [Euwallacea similis]|uniref:NADPH-dependent diflavin oxidoreductase 1 isoform X1 n=1 Tax=Euwallacea similis TaxID=1736056 RepID=UPI00344B08C4